jgi:cell division protein FtsI (penicillin-binding protein 3)
LVSAPVFHNVMDGALRLMDVPPDHIEQWYVQQPTPTPTEVPADDDANAIEDMPYIATEPTVATEPAAAQAPVTATNASGALR